MPVLSKAIETQEIILPDSGAILSVGFSYGDVLAIENAMNDALDLQLGKDTVTTLKGDALRKQREQMFLKGIKAWDFTDEKGKAVPITIENITYLSRQDGKYLREELERLYGEQVSDDIGEKKSETSNVLLEV